IELMMGSAERVNDQCEKGMHEAARRSIVAVTDLSTNTVITKDHLTWVRPGNGLAPGSENLLFGQKTNKPIAAGNMITMNDIVSE
ncbi:MAG: N-acetylneuraminate synthase, partial [Chitinophagaceae bacterium]|nr:N-acetylneuraminate synthase [Chitinophagaceae bacterium]